MSKLALAIEENTTAHYALVADRMPSFEMHREPDAHWYCSGLADGFFNGASWCAFGENVDQRLEEILRRFEERNLPCRFWLGPSSRPSDLGQRLIAHGADLVLDAAGMTADLDQVSADTPSGCTIERVGDDVALRTFLAVISGAYGRPPDPKDPWFEVYSRVGYDSDGPVRHYLGFLDRRPVGAATGVLAAGVLGIYHVHVLPSVRGSGIGSAMTRAPMLEGRKAGLSTAVLHATKMGENLYRRLGFIEQCRFAIYQKVRR